MGKIISDGLEINIKPITNRYGYQEVRKDFLIDSERALNIYNYSPTANCQLGCIDDFQVMLSVYNIKQLKDIFSNISHLKPILLVDLRSGWFAKANKIFKKYIISAVPYKSTNESKMVVTLINIRKFLNEN